MNIILSASNQVYIMSHFLSSDTVDDEDGFDVAMLYPIHDMTPSIPPTAISTESCRTIGLHSESIRR